MHEEGLLLTYKSVAFNTVATTTITHINVNVLAIPYLLRYLNTKL